MSFIDKYSTIFFEKFWSITHLNELSIQDVLITLSIPLCCFIVETLLIGWKSSSLYNIIFHFKTIRGDLWCYLLSVFGLFNFVSVVLTFGLFYWMVGLAQKNVNLNLISYIHNPIAQFAVIFILSDFKDYIRHRTVHSFKPTWELHNYHHSAEYFTMFSFARTHFVESALHKFFDVALFVLVGAPMKYYLWYSVLLETHQYINHSQLKSNWGFIGKYLLVSPAAHRIHHSIDAKFYNKNFGNALIIWDRLFGTYAESEEEIKIGIPNNQYNKKTFLHDIFIGYKASLNALLGRNKTTTNS